MICNGGKVIRVWAVKPFPSLFLGVIAFGALVVVFAKRDGLEVIPQLPVAPAVVCIAWARLAATYAGQLLNPAHVAQSCGGAIAGLAFLLA